MDGQSDNLTVIDLETLVTPEQIPDVDLEAISDTNYMQTLDKPPDTLSKMYALVKILDNIHITSDFDLSTIAKMSAKRLDCLYLMMRMVNLFGMQYCEEMTKHFVERTIQDYLFSEDVTLNRNDEFDVNILNAFLEESNCDMASYLVKFIDQYIFVIKLDDGEQLEVQIEYHTQKFKVFLYQLWNSPFYTPVLHHLGLSVTRANLDCVFDSFREAIRQIINYSKKAYLPFYSKFYSVLYEIFDLETNDDVLYSQLHSYYEIIKISTAHSDAIDRYVALVIDHAHDETPFDYRTVKLLYWKIADYPNYFYDERRRKENRIHLESADNNGNDAGSDDFTDCDWDWNVNENWDNCNENWDQHRDNVVTPAYTGTYSEHYTINGQYPTNGYYTTWDSNSRTWVSSVHKKYKDLLEKYNFQIVDDKLYNNLLDIFAPHLKVANVDKQATADDLACLIADAMTTERNTMGFFNKYDEIDLETPYSLLSVNMDKDIKTYDEFIRHLYLKSQLPFYYPVEFVLRILSRILNIKINFYYEELDVMNIDNTIVIEAQDIDIYQTQSSSYYVIIRIKPVDPLLPTPSSSKPETDDIEI